MQYLLLIHSDEQSYWSLSDEDKAALHEQYGALLAELQQSGAYVGGNQLQPTSKGVTVRVRDGEQVVTDGPFAETKEQLGGYYLIEAETLDEALEWAAKIPAARQGSIEVRPLMYVPDEVPA
jgi:hypothetical protein